MRIITLNFIPHTLIRDYWSAKCELGEYIIQLHKEIYVLTYFGMKIYYRYGVGFTPEKDYNSLSEAINSAQEHFLINKLILEQNHD